MVLNTLRGAPQQLVDRSALPGLGANSMMSGGTPSSARTLTLQASPRALRVGRGAGQPSSKRSAQDWPTTAMLAFEAGVRVPAAVPSRWKAFLHRRRCRKILRRTQPSVPRAPDFEAGGGYRTNAHSIREGRPGAVAGAGHHTCTWVCPRGEDQPISADGPNRLCKHEKAIQKSRLCSITTFYPAAPSSDRGSVVFWRSRIRRGDCGRNDRPGSAATIASAHSPSACAFSSSSSTWFIHGWGS